MPTTRKISRTDVNFCLDVALLSLFLAVCALSVILEFVFPVGTSADGWQLWGRNYAEWSRIRFALLTTMATAVLLHVMLHWSWVCGVVTSRLGTKKSATAHDDPSRTLWGVGLLIVVVNIVGGLVAAAALSIEPPITPP